MTLVDRLMRISKHYLNSVGKEPDGSAQLIGRLLTRFVKSILYHRHTLARVNGVFVILVAISIDFVHGCLIYVKVQSLSASFFRYFFKLSTLY